jgi:curli biogenesis system outer membrane secretion channel CsgG
MFDQQEGSMKSLALSSLLFVLVSACTSFDISDHSAAISDPKPAIKRVAVVDFDFARPETGKTDRGRITRPMNAGSIMADIFAEHLLGSGLYEVVERRKVVRLMRDFEIDASDLFAADKMNKMQQALNIDGLVVGVVTEYGDWRGKLNWGGVVGFSARLVRVDSGSLIWAASANRDMAMTNSTAIAHAASQEALEDLVAKLGR